MGDLREQGLKRIENHFKHADEEQDECEDVLLNRVKRGLEESVGGLGDKVNQFIRELNDEEVVAAAIIHLSKIIVENRFGRF
jgi:hypothetical protein